MYLVRGSACITAYSSSAARDAPSSWAVIFAWSGAHMELLSVLLKPADFDEALACFAKGSDPAPSGPQEAAPSIMDALTNLNKQCTVFKRSANKLGAHTFQEHVHSRIAENSNEGRLLSLQMGLSGLLSVHAAVHFNEVKREQLGCGLIGG